MKAAQANRGRAWRRRLYSEEWLASLAVYRRPRHIAILPMGFFERAAAGADLRDIVVPACRDRGVAHRDGVFAPVGVSYSPKFLWSPLIDRLPIPIVTARLGRRRSWALAIQLPLALASSSLRR